MCLPYPTKRKHDKAYLDGLQTFFVRLNPIYLDAVMNTAGVLSDQQKYQEAEEFYKRALTLQPKNGDAYNNYAAFLGKMGKQGRLSDKLVLL